MLSYKAKFIQRLAGLSRINLLVKFQQVYHYINDVCSFNVHKPKEFLSPIQPKTIDD
jgi:hypothetical protein